VDTDEASVSPKLVALELEGANDDGRVAAEAAGIVAGMKIASTFIGAPRDRLHSIRQ